MDYTLTAATVAIAMNHIATSPQFDFVKQTIQNINKFNPKLNQDLYQELFIYISKAKEEKFLYIFNNKLFRYWLVGVLLNQTRSVTSEWYRMYVRPIVNKNTLFIGDIEKPYDQCIETKIDIQDILNNINDKKLFTVDGKYDGLTHQYIKTLFDLHFVKDMSYREIAAKIGIPSSSVFNAINPIALKLKTKYKKTNI